MTDCTASHAKSFMLSLGCRHRPEERLEVHDKCVVSFHTSSLLGVARPTYAAVIMLYIIRPALLLTILGSLSYNSIVLQVQAASFSLARSFLVPAPPRQEEPLLL